MAIFAVGSIASIIDSDGGSIDDKSTIKGIVNAMPYRDVEWLMIQAIIATGIDDVVEGIYPCPRCHTEVMSSEPDPLFNVNDPEHNDDDADRIRKLKTTICAAVRDFTIELEVPVQKIDADTDEVMEEVNAVKLRDPILDDMIRACRKVGMSNAERLNAAVYAEATLTVNGVPVDRKWKNEWGTWLYDRLDFADTRKVREEVQRYGLKSTIEKRCPKCKKVWEAEVDTGSFFASGLGA